ncbi:hypothetical protein CFE70_006848 [Pyrenophora teres f. teres 0-1]|uniref:Uncharacterized protein n=1 Tax=Pyrenophora teres f. teres (strain 0-1) TaxID=861557 RepID=E3RTW3_PYRTT|nr:hypothetical protein PTT_12477 [Pyrenophora teres f. teres 0-1]
MTHHFILTLISTLLPLLGSCQTVQDSWTAPTTPDGPTSLQSGAPFTIRWKSDLQEALKTYCTSGNVMKLDHWVTSFENDSYKFRLAAKSSSTTITNATSSSMPHPTNPPDQNAGEKTAHTTVQPPESPQLSEMVGDWQHEVGQQGQYPAEVAGSTPEHTAAEL